MKAKLSKVLFLAGGLFFLLAFTNFQTKPWPVPEKYEKMKNPVKADDEAIKAGKALWVKHCQSCHGKTGKGDGTKAAQLETPMEDFTTGAVQNQSDGALFYKTLEGRDEMPSFKKKIPDEEEIWQLVVFVKSLKAK
ncbi:MAG: c-type cytochrome [Cyclobacteriaceae bacterium]